MTSAIGKRTIRLVEHAEGLVRFSPTQQASTNPTNRRTDLWSSMHSRKAFSVLELLLVMALLVVLASVVFPAARTWQSRNEVDRARSALIELIGEGKRRAVRDGSIWTIRVQTKPGQLTLESCRRMKGDTQLPSTESKESRVLANSIQIEFLQPQIDERLDALIVNPMGKTTPARIQLKQNGQQIHFFEIDRLTGSLRTVK